MKKKIAALLAAMILAITIIPVNTMAKETAVSGDKDFKKICSVLAAYTTAIRLSNQAPSGRMNLTLSNDNKLSIAAFARFYTQDDFGFTARELKTETKSLFGKSVNVKSLKKNKKADVLVCASDKKYVSEPFMYCGGEFGDCIPRYKIKKIIKIKKNLYQAELQNRIGIYGEKGTQTIGSTVLRLKKDRSSKYGYIVKQIIFK